MSSFILTEGAEEDWSSIAEYSFDHFGEEQLVKYTDGLIACIERLAKKKGRFKDITVGHVAVRMMRCQKHLVFALVTTEEPLIILAILHERMDWIQRLNNRLIEG